MRILFLEWGHYDENVIEETLRELGHFVLPVKEDLYTYTQSEEMIERIKTTIGKVHPDVLFTIDYFIDVSSAAKASGVKYYSWLYHIPQWGLYSSQGQYPCNCLFSYDTAHIDELRGMGIKAEYVSLAADRKMLDKAVAGFDGDVTKYTSDISFVGSLYESANNSFKAISPEARGEEEYAKIVELVKEKKIKYGGGVLYKGVTDDVVSFLLKEADLKKNNYFFAKDYDIAVYSILARKVTIEERKTVCRTLARKYDFKLYSNSNTERFPEINNMGPVPYERIAPIIFNNSKINVYVTPRAIRTGIPVRVLEIMACGGFVLTNYQEDLAREFEEGRHLEMYRSLDELLEKCDYYLAHEDKRASIAQRGYERVLKEYNFSRKLHDIFSDYRM